MTFKQKLYNIVKKNNSLLCVGLDSDIEKIPEHIRNGEHPQSTFNKEIIDATADLVCAYKSNTAFYEARGKAGIEALKMTCDYIREKHPEIPIILDAKRADIGNTNEGYAKFAFDYLNADAITLHPYLGIETLGAFLRRKDKQIFILCKTSNPGAGELQDLKVDGKPLYQIVAENVVKNWNYNGNCGLVIGAPYPSEVNIVRRIAPSLPFLIPGIGIQGGEVEKTVKAGVDANGSNAIINSSRGVIFASSSEDFAEKARGEAMKLQKEINKFR
ncbi:orotidine-5'-phosphate decarboxylase [Candidatus Gottesmanbacteria bacterium]|nr:orotidine-5'-phosphate decarboxylase [Candidatus Gottesmanbacteria bacterium]